MCHEKFSGAEGAAFIVEGRSGSPFFTQLRCDIRLISASSPNSKHGLALVLGNRFFFIRERARALSFPFRSRTEFLWPVLMQNLDPPESLGLALGFRPCKNSTHLSGDAGFALRARGLLLPQAVRKRWWRAGDSPSLRALRGRPGNALSRREVAILGSMRVGGVRWAPCRMKHGVC